MKYLLVLFLLVACTAKEPEPLKTGGEYDKTCEAISDYYFSQRAKRREECIKGVEREKRVVERVKRKLTKLEQSIICPHYGSADPKVVCGLRDDGEGRWLYKNCTTYFLYFGKH